MIVRALSVFEGVVYHSSLIDPDHPCRPILELEAVVRPGDVDDGPILFPLAEYVVMAGGPDRVRHCLDDLRARGRIVDHLGVAHLAFPFWTPILLDRPPG
ncbi:MAG: hypothetical protein ACR2MB_06220 [Acidimicrobiales bacterium]